MVSRLCREEGHKTPRGKEEERVELEYEYKRNDKKEKPMEVM